MKLPDKGFANLMTHLRRALPRDPRTRLGTLAAVALGSLRSKRRQVGQLLPALPWAGTRAPLKQRGQRLLQNPSVRVALYSAPLARRLLQRRASGGARSQWTIDRPEWGPVTLWSSCVGWRGRAGPLLWARLGPGASSFAEQVKPLSSWKIRQQTRHSVGVGIR